MERNLTEDIARLIVEGELITAGVARKMRQLKSYDKTTWNHSLNVAYISTQLAILCGLEDGLIKNIALGGILHDIGKMRVPKEILLKKSVLSAEEYELVKNHPEWGVMECQDLNLPKNVTDIIIHHHERMDGTGYPDGLDESELPIYVRIVSTVDSYEAMTSKRSYKAPYSSNQSLSLLQFDDGYSQKILDLLEAVQAK